MPQLLIPDIAESLLQQLQQQATRHGRTVEAEARVILEDALRLDPAKVWAEVDAIRNALAATGRDFGDSVQDIREDRERWHHRRQAREFLRGFSVGSVSHQASGCTMNPTYRRHSSISDATSAVQPV